ncbi:MAG TPA: aldo/keto reductase [Acidimicrobiales bacterium]|nr:aldo/keto reductase [Acidimicrobiales bacterium]
MSDATPAAPRRLGSSDLVVGPISYGCWRFAGTPVADARAKIETALDHGMTLIDTADIYGIDTDAGFGSAETLLGEVLAEAPHLRDRMVLATKGGIRPGAPYDSSAEWIRAACEASLRRLGVDVIDLYQIHRPDLLAHPAEAAEALDELRASGKVREVGVSNHTPSQVRALSAHLDAPIVTTQPELSVWQLDALDDGTIDQALELGITPLAWSPLAGGLLVTDDPPMVDEPQRLADVRSVVRRLAEREEATPTQVALAFLTGHPAAVVPIVGTQRVDRIIEAAGAASVTLTKRDRYELIAAAGRPLP